MKEMVFGCSGCSDLKRASCLQAGVLQGSEGPRAQCSLVVFVLHHANNRAPSPAGKGKVYLRFGKEGKLSGPLCSRAGSAKRMSLF